MNGRPIAFADIQAASTHSRVIGQVDVPELGEGAVICIRSLTAHEWERANAIPREIDGKAVFADFNEYLFRCGAVHPDGSQLIPADAPEGVFTEFKIRWPRIIGRVANRVGDVTWGRDDGDDDVKN